MHESAEDLKMNDSQLSIVEGLQLKVHPGRVEMYEELHNRPSPLIESPCFVSHFALLTGEQGHQQDWDRVSELCQRFSVAPPASRAGCFYQNFGGFELRWERHTEFSTFTFIRPMDAVVEGDALSFVPKEWLKQLPGQLVVALHMQVRNEPWSEHTEQHFFEGQRVVGSRVANNKARVLTSFRLHSDGFGRFLVLNEGLNNYQTGRLVQRLLELETYRLLALLGLPLARSIAVEVSSMETQLTSLNHQITQIRNEADERIMLHELSVLAAQIEQSRSDTNYRFAATFAYHDIVSKRLDKVFEQHISGLQTMREFLERRLGPGIKTCYAVRDRLEDLSRRIHRTTSLLRTRVELSIESQNQKLLTSMDRRSSLQLRLQQTVEGLSVVAIGYYLMGLLGYVFEGAAAYGLHVNKPVYSALAVPLVLAAVWWGVHRVKARIARGENSQ